MIGIIYYKYHKNGREQFKKIIENYKQQNIMPIQLKFSSERDIVKFENEDLWLTAQCGDGARGRRWNVAYIEHIIPDRDREIFIYPYGLNYIWCATNDFYSE